MQDFLDQLPTLAKDKHNENKKFFSKLKKKQPKRFDITMQQLHDEEFAETDCLTCANCCKTTGPLFTDKDIERIAKYMKMKPYDFEQKYLRKDEEGDMVLQETPCRFLASDNYCLIYDVRPKACREYPHTDRKKFHQIAHLTMHNVAICPAAFRIVEKMKMLFQGG
ncbi:YkgJ family cysteine cluster protein [Aquimarina hainanensis]|uniref:YkgJ family cysteine cluster protein n=1 Tax=Aquimarina hainanensis TaxID=1578017 RepID=A0ABW5N673_9FLAO|nr:YkgJ family cysteine cluster protein [Aquimarina sp. TRL1]QKX05626.1 YkgJ family cysteine cluster protein [Aquimarina sp. TRL1]